MSTVVLKRHREITRGRVVGTNYSKIEKLLNRTKSKLLDYLNSILETIIGQRVEIFYSYLMGNNLEPSQVVDMDAHNF